MVRVVNSRERSKPLENKEPDLLQTVVSVNRVSKVTRGGKRFGFSALVVVGDTEGSAGFAIGKGGDVAKAVRKAMERARKSMVKVYLKRGITLHHDIKASHGAAVVQLRSARPGTGVIAGGAMRRVFEAFGVRDVVSKSLRSSTSHNLVRATFKGMTSIVSPVIVAQRRHKKVSDVFSRPLARRKPQPMSDQNAVITETTDVK